MNNNKKIIIEIIIITMTIITTTTTTKQQPHYEHQHPQIIPPLRPLPPLITRTINQRGYLTNLLLLVSIWLTIYRDYLPICANDTSRRHYLVAVYYHQCFRGVCGCGYFSLLSSLVFFLLVCFFVVTACSVLWLWISLHRISLQNRFCLESVSKRSINPGICFKMVRYFLESVFKCSYSMKSSLRQFRASMKPS